jgi:hypothetical protein
LRATTPRVATTWIRRRELLMQQWVNNPRNGIDHIFTSWHHIDCIIIVREWISKGSFGF